ncbi:MAG: hypothetical protein WAM04_07535 [Candidatus Sulfotelmatobacter sp.]
MGPNRNSTTNNVKGNPHWTREFDQLRFRRAKMLQDSSHLQAQGNIAAARKGRRHTEFIILWTRKTRFYPPMQSVLVDNLRMGFAASSALSDEKKEAIRVIDQAGQHRSMRCLPERLG